MSDLSDKIIQKIETDKIKPIPKSHFIRLRILVWVLFVLTLLVGSMGAGLTFFLIRNAEWDLYRHLGHSFTEFFILVTPWFWVITLCLFTTAAFYYFRKTGRGYRFNTIAVILTSFTLSVSGGILLNMTTAPEQLETIFTNTFDWYAGIHDHRHKMWNNPDNGFLAGTIIQVKSNTRLTIEDLTGGHWDVDVSQTDWRGRTMPEKGFKIKLIGQRSKQSPSFFIATEIRPWHGRGMMRGKGKHHKDGPRHQNGMGRRK